MDAATDSYSVGTEGGSDIYGVAFQDLYVTDPVDAQVNEDLNRLNYYWNPTFGCFTKAQAIHYRYWFSGTYWHPAAYYNQYFHQFDCLTVDNIMGSGFWNQWFCQPDEVDVDYYNRLTLHIGFAEYDDFIDIGGYPCATLTPHVDRVSGF